MTLSTAWDTKETGGDFAARLEYIAAGRKWVPWLRLFGWAKGTIDKVRNLGHVPKTDALLPLVRAENVNLHWLLDGQGAPYRVHAAASDGEAADYLAALLEETGWHAMAYTDGDRTVMVLTRPGEQRIRDQWVPYTMLEVLTAAGPRTLDLASRRCRGLRQAKVDPESLEALARGETAGTYRLTQAETPPFQRLEEIRGTVIREEAADYAPAALTRDERSLLRAWRRVPEDQRERALAVIEAFVPEDEHGQN